VLEREWEWVEERQVVEEGEGDRSPEPPRRPGEGVGSLEAVPFIFDVPEREAEAEAERVVEGDSVREAQGVGEELGDTVGVVKFPPGLSVAVTEALAVWEDDTVVEGEAPNQGGLGEVDMLAVAVGVPTPPPSVRVGEAV